MKRDIILDVLKCAAAGSAGAWALVWLLARLGGGTVGP